MVRKMVLLRVSPGEPPLNWLLLLRNKSASFSFIRLQLLLKPIFIGVPHFLANSIIPQRNLGSLSNYITLFFRSCSRTRKSGGILKTRLSIRTNEINKGGMLPHFIYTGYLRPTVDGSLSGLELKKRENID